MASSNGPMVYVALQQFCEQDPRPLQALRDAGYAVGRNTLGRRLRRNEMVDALQGADAVLAGLEPYDVELLSRLPRLRCISRCGVGTDAIDLAATAKRGINVLTTDDEVVEPVAQLTVAMVLALARHLLPHAADMRQGRWEKRTGALLSEWTIGLVGFGRIGRAVERFLRSFGSRVLVCDPQIRAGEVSAPVEVCDLPSLLSGSDVVSLHATRRRDDGCLIGRGELALMKPGGYLINTARGFLVDEAALHEALLTGHLAGAALDVFDAEPYRGPLAALPQVLCTPHVGSLTGASRVKMEWRCAQNVVEHFARHPLEARA